MKRMLCKNRNRVTATARRSMRGIKARTALRLHAAKRRGPGMPYFVVFSCPYSTRALVEMATGKRARHL